MGPSTVRVSLRAGGRIDGVGRAGPPADYVCVGWAGTGGRAIVTERLFVSLPPPTFIGSSVVAAPSKTTPPLGGARVIAGGASAVQRARGGFDAAEVASAPRREAQGQA